MKPRVVYLCAQPAPDDRLEPFLKRLAGLLKHDIERRAGAVDAPRLAAALGQRLITTRKGLEWLDAAGKLRVIDWSEQQLTVTWGAGQVTEEAAELESQLRRLLSETAAWRQYYRRLNVEQIAAVVRRERRGISDER